MFGFCSNLEFYQLLIELHMGFPVSLEALPSFVRDAFFISC